MTFTIHFYLEREKWSGHGLTNRTASYGPASFNSKESLKKFLTDKEAVEKEVSSAIGKLFKEEAKSSKQPQFSQSPSVEQFQVAVDMKVYLVSPAVGHPPTVNKINLVNHSLMFETWKRSKLFDFTNTMFTKPPPPILDTGGDQALVSTTPAPGSTLEVNTTSLETNEQFDSANTSSTSKRGDESAELADLQVELKGVIAWFELGVQLKIPTHDLLAIREDHRTVEKCRLDMLIKWEQLEKPTWNKLFSGLVNIGMKGLADSLAEKYGLPQPFRVAVTPVKGSASSKLMESEQKLTVKTKELKQAKQLQTVTSRKLEKEVSAEVPLLQHKVKSLTTETEFLKMQLERRNEEMKMFEKMKLSAKEDELQLLDSLLKEKNEQISSLQKELTQKETELDATKKQLKDKETELAGMMEELSAKSDQVCVLESEVKKLRQSFDEQQEEMNRKLIEQSAASVSHEKYLREVEIQRDIAEKEASKKKEEIQSYTQELTDKEEQISRLSEKIVEQEREMTKLREELDSHHRTLKEPSAEQTREDDEREQQLLTLMMSAMKLQLELRQTIDKKNQDKMNLEGAKKTVEKYERMLSLADAKDQSSAVKSIPGVKNVEMNVEESVEESVSPLTHSDTPPIHTSQESLRNVVALYSFTGRSDQEISFKEGDILKVTEKKYPDWWYGMDSDGRQGLIPVNYVKIQESSSRTPSIDNVKAKDELVRQKKGTSMIQLSESNNQTLGSGDKGQSSSDDSVAVTKHSEMSLLDSSNISLSWRAATSAPYNLIRWVDAAVNGDTVYFRQWNGPSVYAYNSTSDTWCQLPDAPTYDCSITVINGTLTTVGGERDGQDTNQLFSLSDESDGRRKWVETLPPMPEKVLYTRTVCCGTHLIVALRDSSTIYIMDITSHKWSQVSNQPCFLLHSLVMCGEYLYFVYEYDNTMFRCSTSDLIQSTESNETGIWTELKYTGLLSDSAYVAIHSRLISVGGRDSQDKHTTAVRMYSPTTKTWDVIGHMKTPRYRCFAAVLPNNRLFITGGLTNGYTYTREVEIATVCLDS